MNTLDILTDRQVAEIFLLNPRSGWRVVQKMARNGKLKGFKVGDFWRFTRQSIEDYTQRKAR